MDMSLCRLAPAVMTCGLPLTVRVAHDLRWGRSASAPKHTAPASIRRRRHTGQQHLRQQGDKPVADDGILANTHSLGVRCFKAWRRLNALVVINPLRPLSTQDQPLPSKHKEASWPVCPRDKEGDPRPQTSQAQQQLLRKSKPPGYQRAQLPPQPSTGASAPMDHGVDLTAEPTWPGPPPVGGGRRVVHVGRASMPGVPPALIIPTPLPSPPPSLSPFPLLKSSLCAPPMTPTSLPFPLFIIPERRGMGGVEAIPSTVLHAPVVAWGHATVVGK
ncbi:hypothetical protein BHM03_00012187 [Ensete ventricosum]|nr:hypothetical protein BHM03_00012187 [Ensete ventricosum]